MVEVRRYNFRVPTPFYHLSLALELLENPGLTDEARRFLQARRGEFLFGNTAPDVQVVSGQRREDTHFFNIPILPNDQAAWEVLLGRYPHLAAPARLTAGQAAFVAGYLCHLQADWMWIRQIFAPSFGPGCTWGSFYDRLYYHNVLRAYLDQCILPSLGSGIDTLLGRVNPDGWLPFVESRRLAEWRDFISTQLRPGAATKTVEVFSSRQGISVPEYYALLGSEERMQGEVFEHVPLEQVQRYQQSALEENFHLLSSYLASALHPKDIVIERQPSQGAHP